MRRRSRNARSVIQLIESIAKTDRQWPLLSVSSLLYVASILYGGGMAIRAQLYRKGLLQSRRLPCRVVSIGNITAGGTGKTPMTIFVARAIERLGYRVVVISRGYKGRLERSGGVVSDGRNVLVGPEEAGDEPYLMATSLTGIPVVVGGDRYRAGMLAMRRFAPDVIVLDDAFQHLRLKRDIDIVLLDHRSPLGIGHLLPRGRLREPISALRRAHAFVFTRTEAAAGSGHPCLSVYHRPVFHTRHLPVVRVVHAADDLAVEGHVDFSIFKGRAAVAFSGLAENDQFFDSLTQSGCRIVDELSFNDHQQYGAGDIDRILEKAIAKDADLLITTAKDWVKIQFLCHWPMTVVAVDVRIGWQGNLRPLYRFLSAGLSMPVTRS